MCILSTWKNKRGKTWSKTQMLIDFGSGKKKECAVQWKNVSGGWKVLWVALTIQFLVWWKICSSRKLLHVMQIIPNLFRNIFGGKKSSSAETTRAKMFSQTIWSVYVTIDGKDEWRRRPTQKRRSGRFFFAGLQIDFLILSRILFLSFWEELRAWG